MENSKTTPAICLGKKPDNNASCYNTGLLYQNSMCVCDLGNGVYYSGDGNIACSNERTLNISETDKDNLINKILERKSGENGSYKICDIDNFGTIATTGVVSGTTVTTGNICVCKTGYDVSSNAGGCSCRDSNNRHYTGGACKCDVNGAELDKNTSDGKCACGKGFEKQEDLNGNMKCTECNTGYYKDTVSNTSCTACRAGTYNPNTGSKASSACLPCDAGEYSEAGANACITCPKGYYCPGGKDKIKCAAGTYQDQTGQPSCKKASKGYYVSSKGASDQTACEGPNYTDQTGQTKCTTCPGWSEETGTSVDPAYKESILFSDLGYYTSSRIHDTKGGCYVKIKVDKYKPMHSSFSNTDTAIWCYVDPDGNGGYADTYGYNGKGTDPFGCRIDTSKFKCDAGYYSDADGDTITGAKYDKVERIYSHTLKNLWTGACVSVGDGYYSSASELERHACKDLDLGSNNPTNGTYSSVSPWGAKTDCRYQAPDKKITGCLSVTTNIAEYGGTAWADTTYTVSANKGYYSSNNNKYSATCTACPKGKYNPDTDSTEPSACKACPLGTYNDKTGQEKCTFCEAGQTTDNTESKEATSCKDCLSTEKKSYVKEWATYDWKKDSKFGVVDSLCIVQTCKSFSNTKFEDNGIASATITLSSDKKSCTHSVTCSPGWHTPTPTASENYKEHPSCTGCAAGYYCTGDGKENPCDKDTYSEATQSSCSKCSDKTEKKYSKSDGTTGTKGNETTLANKIEECYVELVPGKYVKDEKTGLVDCPAGYYCPGCKEADFKVTGDDGWKNYIDKGTDNTACNTHTKMYYNQTTGGDFKCPAGTYQNTNSSDNDKHVKPSDCTKCKAGAISLAGSTSHTGCSLSNETNFCDKDGCFTLPFFWDGKSTSTVLKIKQNNEE